MMIIISQAVVDGLEDARAVEEPFSIALTRDNEGLHFDVTIDVSEFLRAIFHFPVRYLQSFRKGIIGLYTEFFEETEGTCIG
jgi:hypothetical protein